MLVEQHLKFLSGSKWNVTTPSEH